MDGENRGISYKLAAVPGKYLMTVNLAGSGMGGSGSVAICIDNTCSQLSPEKKTYRITAVNPGRLYLRSDIDVAYVVLTSIEWERTD